MFLIDFSKAATTVPHEEGAGLPYKERFLDTILYCAKKILRAIHKGITSFFLISFQFCRRLLVSK